MFMRVHLGWPQSGVLDPATDLGAMTSGSRIVPVKSFKNLTQKGIVKSFKFLPGSQPPRVGLVGL